MSLETLHLNLPLQYKNGMFHITCNCGLDFVDISREHAEYEYAEHVDTALTGADESVLVARRAAQLLHGSFEQEVVRDAISDLLCYAHMLGADIQLTAELAAYNAKVEVNA